ncbi:hypothetical protein [Endozoicomonas sp. ONNA2]|uniref:hypothetical protein n=1 Tax=Endozoicomonas sp. ONNA2 TaxID=2828741 RepID=UPI0021494ACD|nr:hypothetical protein [Endozoicomonas sp. ONNA2]
MDNLPGNSTTNLFAPPSYNYVVGMDRKAQFQQYMATAITTTQAIISDGERYHSFEPEAVAKELIEYLINRYPSASPQVGRISTGPKNPTEPDMNAWSDWERRHCSNAGGTLRSFKSECVQNAITDAFVTHLGKEQLDKFKQFMIAEGFSEGCLFDCNDTCDVVHKFFESYNPMVPVIIKCIKAGVFSQELINDLLNIR